MINPDEPPVEVYAKTQVMADALITKLIEMQPLFDKFGAGNDAIAYGAFVTKLSTTMEKDELAIALAAAIRKLYKP